MSKSTRTIIIVCFIIIIGIYFMLQKQLQHPVTQVSTPSSTTGSVTIAIDNSAACHAQLLDPADPQAILPDSNCTPGAINQAVTQDNLDQTICQPGYTKTIRPKASYTSALKRQQIKQYGYLDTTSKDYEEDHLISLELGGSPDDPKNLWPEPHPAPNEKDKVENYLHTQVCERKIQLQEAQKEITANWYTVYKRIAN